MKHKYHNGTVESGHKTDDKWSYHTVLWMDCGLKIFFFAVLSELFHLPDAVFVILSGVGSFLRSLIFLTAPDVNTLNAVFILGDFYSREHS